MDDNQFISLFELGEDFDLLQMFEGAEGDGVYTVDLNDQAVASPPPKSKALILTGSQVASLPPEVTQLANLRVLKLDCEQLASLPPELGRLTGLRMLDLNSN